MCHAMVLHAGATYADGDVSIQPPKIAAMRTVALAGDLTASFEEWSRDAAARSDVYYFAVYYGEAVVGQIFLHDIDLARGEALVGCHLFVPAFRGRGIGTRALRLMQRFVESDRPELGALVAITNRANRASQGAARRCGFVETGVPREDPERGVVLRWGLRRPSTSRE